MRLHPAQTKLLQILRDNQSSPLSIRELQEEISAKSPSVIQHHIKQLEKKGYLKRNPSNTRDYQILNEPDSEIVYLNMYGMAQCGPNGQFLDGNPIEMVPIYSPMLGFQASEAFLVKARGNSMEPYIHNGDMIIAKKASSAQDKEIIICVNDGEVLVKKIQKIINKDKTVSYNLISLNTKFNPFLANENFQIAGVVRGVLKHTIST